MRTRTRGRTRALTFLAAVAAALGPLGPAVPAAAAAATVCSVSCDTRDPSAGVEVRRATGDSSALAAARRLADSAVGSSALVSGGLLTESCDSLTAQCDDNQKQFKGIFMRYLSDLDGAAGGACSSFIATQTTSLWNADRDTLDRFGERWSGQNPGSYPNVRDWRTQAGALEAFPA